MARRTKKASRAWTQALLGLMLVAGAAVAGLLLLRDYLNARPLRLEPVTESIATRFERSLEESMVPSDAIRLRSRRTERTPDAVWNLYHYDVEIPPTLAVDKMGDMLRHALRDTDVTVHDIREGPAEVTLSLQIADHEFLIARLHTKAPDVVAVTRPKPPESHEPSADEPGPGSYGMAFDVDPWSWFRKLWSGRDGKPTIAPASPRLAIILDDGGYGGPATDAVLALDPRLTLSILPYTPHDEDTAHRAAEAGFQVMLHMPMETHNGDNGFAGGLRVDMDADRIDRGIQAALDEVPHVAGVNNHTGSKFTENEAAVAAMVDALKRRGLFFIDSRTLHTTVAMRVACEHGVPAAERNVFLDHENTRDAIVAQWEELTALCRERGHAIGIGHFRELTAEVLAEVLPGLDDLGIELVHAGDLVGCE